MRALHLLPLTFIIGIQGFAMFAPYVILLLLAAWAVERLRTAPSSPQAQPVALPA
jgi:hypothetical protein